mgnify:CR=1 FL=1
MSSTLEQYLTMQDSLLLEDEPEIVEPQKSQIERVVKTKKAKIAPESKTQEVRRRDRKPSTSPLKKTTSSARGGAKLTDLCA